MLLGTLHFQQEGVPESELGIEMQSDPALPLPCYVTLEKSQFSEPQFLHLRKGMVIYTLKDSPGSE